MPIKPAIFADEKKEYYFFLGILIVFSLFTVIMFMPENKLYPGYDGYFHYNRIKALMEAITDGSFPVYIEADAANGFGYGTKLFYSDFLLIPIALVAFITNLTFAYKLFLFFELFLCGYFTYIATNKIFKSPRIAYLTGFLVTFSYFRFIALFLRCAFGESLSYIFVPVVVWGLYEIISGNYKKWYIFSLGFALLLMSHLITSVLTALIGLVFIIANYKAFWIQRKRFYALITASVVILILSVYATLPMLEQMWSNEFLLTNQAGNNTPARNKLGIVHLLVGFIAGFKVEDKNVLHFMWDQGAGAILTILVLFRFFVKQKSVQIKYADICLIAGLILTFATTAIIPWGRFPLTLLKFIQFPWRLFEYVTFFFAVAGSTYLIYWAATKRKLIISLSLIALATIIMICINSYNYRNSYYLSETSWEPTIQNNFNLGSLEYTPIKYVHYTWSFWERIYNRKEEILTQHEDTRITNYLHAKSNISFDIDTKGKTDSIMVPLFYYKGYTARFENKEIPVTQTKMGLVGISVNGSGNIDIDFTGTFIQRYTFYVSFLGFILLILYIIYGKRRKKF